MYLEHTVVSESESVLTKSWMHCRKDTAGKFVPVLNNQSWNDLSNKALRFNSYGKNKYPQIHVNK